MNHFEKMEIARAIVRKRAPYISTMLFSLIPMERPGMLKRLGVGIATTAKLVMPYDPDWWVSLTDEEAAACLFHETQHPIRRHFSRGEQFPDKRKANVCADFSINVDTREAGFTLPEGVAWPDKRGFPEGLSLEEYYELWPDPPESPDGGGGQGDQEAESPLTDGPAGHGQCGGAAGNPLPEEEEIEKEVEEESPGATKSQADIEAVLKAQAKEINDFVSRQGRGSVPEELIEWAKFETQPPKIPWKRKLPRLIRRALGVATAGGENFSRRRLSKRSFVRGYVVPGLISHKPEIAFIRDTSGSMGAEQLQEAQNESIGAMKAAGVDQVWFMDADADAGPARRVSIKDIPKLPITGRGGTDFGPALEAVAKLKPRPKVVMYYTDGDGYAPPSPPPGMTVIWVIISSYYNKKPCNWGHCVFTGEGELAEYEE